MTFDSLDTTKVDSKREKPKSAIGPPSVLVSVDGGKTISKAIAPLLEAKNFEARQEQERLGTSVSSRRNFSMSKSGEFFTDFADDKKSFINTGILENVTPSLSPSNNNHPTSLTSLLCANAIDDSASPDLDLKNAENFTYRPHSHVFYQPGAEKLDNLNASQFLNFNGKNPVAPPSSSIKVPHAHIEHSSKTTVKSANLEPENDSSPARPVTSFVPFRLTNDKAITESKEVPLFIKRRLRKMSAK